MAENAITRWLNRGEASRDFDPEESRVAKRHAGLAEINATVTEYATLIEQVSAERAELLATISAQQLQLAELSVAKTLYVDLEEELKALRQKVDDASVALADNRVLRTKVERMESDIEALVFERDDLKRENAYLRGQVTRLKNKDAATEPDK